LSLKIVDLIRVLILLRHPNLVVNNVTFTPLDAIDGGAGTDTLNVTQVAAFTMPAGATVVNVETANITSGATVTANTSVWTASSMNCSRTLPCSSYTSPTVSAAISLARSPA